MKTERENRKRTAEVWCVEFPKGVFVKRTFYETRKEAEADMAMWPTLDLRLVRYAADKRFTKVRAGHNLEGRHG